MSFATVSFNLGPLKAEIDLQRFIDLVRSIATIKLDPLTMDAVKAAIAEVYNGYELIIDTLTPFYRICDEASFKSQFPIQYEIFVNIRLKNYTRRISACHRVYDMIDKLSQNTGWKSRLPGAREKLENLKKLADNWFINDNRVYGEMKKFHDELYNGLNIIYNDFPRKSTNVCLEELRSFLSKAKPDFDNMETKLVDLIRISAEL